jgi:hypothetical protein
MNFGGVISSIRFVERRPGLLIAGTVNPLLADTFESALGRSVCRVRLLLAAERLAAHAALAGCPGNVLGTRQRHGPCFGVG